MSKGDELLQWLNLLPQPELWPALATLQPRLVRPRGDWDLPGLSYAAIRGAPASEGDGWLPLALLQLSIILVDDILDQEIDSQLQPNGAGVVANTAFAIQALAFQALEQMALAPESYRAVSRCLTSMCVQTAYGQQLDVANLVGEENYWRLIRAKSAPFYRASLEVGALIAGADAALIEGVSEFGTLLGEMVQIVDDQMDAFEQPANADWLEGRNNLLIMYALTSDNPEKERFRALRAQVADIKALTEAQLILGHCGAVSYALFLRRERLLAMWRLAQNLPLKNPQPLKDLVMMYAEEAAAMLRRTGVAISAESLLNLPPTPG